MRNLENLLKINISLILIITLVLGTMISCSPSPKESEQEQEQVQQQIQTLKTMVEPEIPATVPPVQEDQPIEAEQTGETVMMNPPHGQPFHRCDIPVGSPLPQNSAAPANASANVKGTEISPAEKNTANVTNAQAINTGVPELNPPHGQPYHRCDIPVGSPLNAAPPAKTTPVINRTGTAPTLENAARLNNARLNNTSAPAMANTTPPKLNPPHGQPFHRCDIAVGSPLPVN